MSLIWETFCLQTLQLLLHAIGHSKEPHENAQDQSKQISMTEQFVVDILMLVIFEK